MSTKTYDIVIFGATGFTGQYVAKELHRVQQEKGNEELRWAIAGRSDRKLKEVVKDLNIGDVQCIVADVSIQKSLNKMCAAANIIIDCVGPFQNYGEPVVKACIDNKCHYIDVSGETFFIEQIESKYHQQAKDAGVFVVSACGFDSIPHDLGVIYTENNFPGKLECVETFMEFFQSAGFNTGTWESFILSIANYSNLRSLRRHQNKPKLPKGVLPPCRKALFYNSRFKKWCVPFPGPDNAVVRRTQRYLYETSNKSPVNLMVYATMDSLCQGFMLFFGFAMIYILSGFSWGRKVLFQFPSVFSGGMAKKGGPSKDKIKDTTFAITFFGYGKSDNAEGGDNKTKVVTRVRGVEPGYIATAALLVQSAMCINNSRAQMPESGGVYTPAVAFANTPLIDNLEKTGKVIFEVLEPSK